MYRSKKKKKTDKDQVWLDRITNNMKIYTVGERERKRERARERDIVLK